MPRAASFARVRGPDLEVLAAVAGRGVHEAGAGVVGDVIAGEQRHVEIVAAIEPLAADARRSMLGQRLGATRRELLERSHARLPQHFDGEFVGEHEACRRPWPNCPSGRR